jgi:ceramide glucosyltransferase
LNGWIALRDAFLLVALSPLIYYVLALIAARRFFRESSTASACHTPPISILKPIRGLDRDTYENYASWCRQRYSEFELIFCVFDETEPAIPVIEQLIRDFPDCSIRLLVGSTPLGISDKVNKLCRMVREARYDTVLISDSDVRVDPGFLTAVAAPLRDHDVGGVTCLYRGLTDGSLAADLEALGNSTDFAPGVLTAWLLGDIDFMLGAVMLTTKGQLTAIGGFESLVDYFCDDYELGNRIAATGHRVVLSGASVAIVYPAESLADAFRHQLRWNLSIRHSRPLGHFGLLFSQGLPWAILGALLAPSLALKLAFLTTYAVLRVWVALKVGSGMKDDLPRKKLWLLPLRDAFAFVVWFASFFPQRIHWREQQFYIRNKRLVPVASRHS